MCQKHELLQVFSITLKHSLKKVMTAAKAIADLKQYDINHSHTFTHTRSQPHHVDTITRLVADSWHDGTDILMN